MATFQKNQPVFQKPGHSPLLLLHSTREAISTAIDALKAVQDYEKFLYQAFHRLTSYTGSAFETLDYAVLGFAKYII